jgi:hypothetical protein
MGFNAGPTERRFVDVFDRIVSGYTTATAGAITAGSQASVSITVPGVSTGGSQPWTQITVWSSVYPGAVDLEGFVSATNTVTLLITNNSGGTITPPANTVYGVVMGRLNPRVTQPNLPGGTSG